MVLHKQHSLVVEQFPRVMCFYIVRRRNCTTVSTCRNPELLQKGLLHYTRNRQKSPQPPHTPFLTSLLDNSDGTLKISYLFTSFFFHGSPPVVQVLLRKCSSLIPQIEYSESCYKVFFYSLFMSITVVNPSVRLLQVKRLIQKVNIIQSSSIFQILDERT